MKETAMGEGWRGGLHYGDLSAAVDAPEGRRSDAGRNVSVTGQAYKLIG
jgi:hypothetical protein